MVVVWSASKVPRHFALLGEALRVMFGVAGLLWEGPSMGIGT